MKLMVLILNRTDCLGGLLEGFSVAGIGGATVIDSEGLAQTLKKLDSSVLTETLRELLGSSQTDNKTVISVIRDEQLDTARRVIYVTVGNLALPNTGILFTVPIDFAEGLPTAAGTAQKTNEAKEN